MKTERLDVRTASGQQVAVWRSAPEEMTDQTPVVVLSAGFARRMRDVSGMALCLARNHALVYRFDSVNHLGLSDGEIEDFSLGGLYESLAAVVELARSTEGRSNVKVVTLSLSLIAALWLAAGDSEIDGITAISGVVDGRATLNRVIGQNYVDVSREELPSRVEVLGHSVDPFGIWQDNQTTGILSMDTTVGHLNSVRSPVANFVASEDPWVDIDECQAVFTAGAAGPRTVVRLPYSGHDLGRNPVATTTILERMTEIVLGSEDSTQSAKPIMPLFNEFLEVRVAERRREQDERNAFAGQQERAS